VLDEINPSDIVRLYPARAACEAPVRVARPAVHVAVS